MHKKLIYLEQKQNKTYHFNKGELTLPFFFNLKFLHLNNANKL